MIYLNTYSLFKRAFIQAMPQPNTLESFEIFCFAAIQLLKLNSLSDQPSIINVLKDTPLDPKSQNQLIDMINAQDTYKKWNSHYTLIQLVQQLQTLVKQNNGDYSLEGALQQFSPRLDIRTENEKVYNYLLKICDFTK